MFIDTGNNTLEKLKFSCGCLAVLIFWQNLSSTKLLVLQQYCIKIPNLLLYFKYLINANFPLYIYSVRM